MKSVVTALAGALSVCGAAQAQNLHVNPANGAISSAVKAPAGSEMLYVSGITPDAVAGARPPPRSATPGRRPPAC